MRSILTVFLIMVATCSSAQQLTNAQFREDFEYFWKAIELNYCYWEKKKTDWAGAKEIYAKDLDTITQKKSFVQLLERMFIELYDHHAGLNTNTAESYRLVPSGTDIWAEYVDNEPVITEVRRDYGAERAGLKAGMKIIAINDVPIETAVRALMPKTLKKEDPAARDFVLRLLLAGKHNEERKITVRHAGKQYHFFPDQPLNLLKQQAPKPAIESRILKNKTGYIRINNRLWDNGLIPVFDSVMQSMKGTNALILDLRETPGGGNTTVARAILGSFISREGFYQKHELTAEEKAFGIKRSWLELVSPRKNIYTRPLVVLANHWTGSVGEGIVIGFDALKRATIVGSPMAGLNGAVYSYRMPHTGIGFSFPVEQLFHVNGRRREDFIPSVTMDLRQQKPGEDTILDKALKILSSK
jgi:carboxyl-terminal processing protease